MKMIDALAKLREISKTYASEDVERALETGAMTQVDEGHSCGCDANCPCGGNCGPHCNCHAGCHAVTEEVTEHNELEDILKLAGRSGTMGMTSKPMALAESVELDESEDPVTFNGKKFTSYKRFSTDKQANDFLEKNEKYGMLGKKDGYVYVAKNADLGESKLNEGFEKTCSNMLDKAGISASFKDGTCYVDDEDVAKAKSILSKADNILEPPPVKAKSGMYESNVAEDFGNPSWRSLTAEELEEAEIELEPGYTIKTDHPGIFKGTKTTSGVVGGKSGEAIAMANRVLDAIEYHDPNSSEEVFALARKFCKEMGCTDDAKKRVYKKLARIGWFEPGKNYESNIAEDFGSSDQGAVVRMMDDQIERTGLSPESIEDAARDAAEMYYDAAGYESPEEATDAFIGMWTRRSEMGQKLAQMFAPVVEDQINDIRQLAGMDRLPEESIKEGRMSDIHAQISSADDPEQMVMDLIKKGGPEGNYLYSELEQLATEAGKTFNDGETDMEEFIPELLANMGIEEGYNNEPDEEYQDVEDQMSLAGGLNGPKKMYAAAAGGDNPMSMAAPKEKITFESVYKVWKSFKNDSK